MQLRRRHLEDVAVLDRRHAVNGLRRDVHALAGRISRLTSFAALLNLEQQLPGVQVDRLVLQVVILEAERVAGVHVNQLAHVPIRLRPVQLVAPRLLDARHISRSPRYSPSAVSCRLTSTRPAAA